MKEFNTIALFRLSVLGPLVSRERLERGELQTIIRGLASKEYAIPGSDRRFLGEKTIEAWYYAWRAHGIDGLIPRQRTDPVQYRVTPYPGQRSIVFCSNKASRVRRVPRPFPRNIGALSLNMPIQSGMAMSCMAPR